MSVDDEVIDHEVSMRLTTLAGPGSPVGAVVLAMIAVAALASTPWPPFGSVGLNFIDDAAARNDLYSFQLAGRWRRGGQRQWSLVVVPDRRHNKANAAEILDQLYKQPVRGRMTVPMVNGPILGFSGNQIDTADSHP